MDCIFMLTRNDLTVEDCLQVYDAVRDVPLHHVGFKDMGVPVPVLRELHARIRADGRRTYLEMVSTDAESQRRSVDTALELGVDCLMGGTDVTTVLGALAQSRTRYFPFPGKPVGHPSRGGGHRENDGGRLRGRGPARLPRH